MKTLVSGFMLVLLATSVSAQQQQRPQVQRAPSGNQAAVEQSAQQHGGSQLAPKQKQQLYTKALEAKQQINLGDLGAPVTLTPRNMYANSTTYATMWRGTVVPSMGPTGVAHVFGLGSFGGNHSYLELHFRAAGGKRYIVDCAFRSAGSARLSVGGGDISTVDNHLVTAVASTAQAREVKVELFSQRGFEWTQCDIVPVDR